MSIILDRKEIQQNWPNSPATAGVTVQTAPSSSGEMRVSVAVSDKALRETLKAAGKDFDGLERPVALVSDGTQFNRFAMRYVGSTPAKGQTPAIDHYELLLGSHQYDLYDAIKHGVALLLETGKDNEEVWLQQKDDNYIAVPK